VKQTFLFLTIFVAITFSGFSQTLSFNSQFISCATLGSATVTTSGGIGPFSYTWIPSSQTGSIATGLKPGTYTIFAFDFGNNSTFSANTVFSSPIPFAGTLSAPGPLRCNGVATGTAAYTNFSGGSGNQNYLWTNGSTNFTVAVPFGLSAGTWTSVVSDALTSCSLTNTFVITQPPALTLTAAASSSAACATNNLTLTANGSGGTPALSYIWSGGPQTNTYLVNQSISGSYVYTVEIKDGNDCLKSQTISATFNPLPIFTVASSAANVCVGNNISFFANSTFTPAILSYQWSGPSGFSSSLQSPSISAAVVANSGVYSIMVTGANSCVASSTINVAVSSLPVISASGNPACETQTISLSAFSPTGLVYLWSGPAGYTSNVQFPLISPASLNAAGNYTVVVFSSVNSCSASATASVAVFPKPALSLIGSTVCANQSMTLSASSTPGTFFSWTGPLGFTSPNPNAIITLASLAQSGTYSVVATGTNGCPTSSTVSALVRVVPSPTLSNNSPVCSGENLTLFGSGAVFYNWSGPASYNSAVQSPTITAVGLINSGTYTVVVTAANGCTASANISVVVHLTPLLSAFGSSVCIGNTFSLTATAIFGANYIWTGPLNYSSVLQNNFLNSASFAQVGFYTVVATDAVGCAVIAIASLSINPNPVITISSNSPLCVGSSLNLTSNPGGSSYIWSGPAGFSSTLQNPSINVTNINNNGAYGLIVSGANSCTASASMSVDVNPLPVLSISGSTVCAGNTLSLSSNSSSATIFLWSGPNSFSSSQQNISFTNATATQTGNYTVVVTGSNNCSNKAIAIGSVVPLPLITMSLSSDVICSRETASLTVTGANTYTWSTGALNYIIIVTPSITSTYSVAGSGAFSCSNSAVATLSVVLCTGIDEPIKNSEFLIYPNPVQNEINIQGIGVSNYSVSVINSVGQIIKSIQQNNLVDQRVDVTDLENGIYFIRLQGLYGFETKRFVINR